MYKRQSLPFSPFSSPPIPFPLEAGSSLKPARGSGHSRGDVSSLSGVRSKAENEFGGNHFEYSVVHVLQLPLIRSTVRASVRRPKGAGSAQLHLYIRHWRAARTRVRVRVRVASESSATRSPRQTSATLVFRGLAETQPNTNRKYFKPNIGRKKYVQP